MRVRIILIICFALALAGISLFIYLANQSVFEFRNYYKVIVRTEESIETLREVEAELSQAESSVRTYIFSKDEKDLEFIYTYPGTSSETNTIQKWGASFARIESALDNKLIAVADSISISANSPSDLKARINKIREKVSEKFNNEDKLLVLTDEERLKKVYHYLSSTTDSAYANVFLDDSTSFDAESSFAENEFTTDTSMTVIRRELAEEFHQDFLELPEDVTEYASWRAQSIRNLIKQDQKLMQEIREEMKKLEAIQEEKKQEYYQTEERQVLSIKVYIYILGSLTTLFLAGIGGLIWYDYVRNTRLQAKLRTERNKAQKLARTKEEFLANMSHEIRTPMNAIIGFTEQLANTSLSNNQNRYLNTIRHSADYLLALLNDVLDYSKLEAGKFQLERVGFKPATILAEVCEIFQNSAVEKGLQFNLEKQNKLPDILVGDPLRLKQMLFNLLSNAIKFTPQGSVTLAAMAKAEKDDKITLILKVVDTGIGIPADKLDDIFNDFSQADSSTSRKYGGTGLGLSITKKLAEMHEGSIVLQSEVHKGTSAILTLSYEKGKLEELDLEQVGTLKVGHELEGVRVLVADDAPYNLQLTQTIMQKWGMIVDLAHHGREALQMLARKKYDVILLDLQMPELDGFSVAKYIRGPMKLQTPILALTASSAPSEIERAKAVGMNGYMIKPFREQELANYMFTLLGKKNTVNPTETPGPIKKASRQERPFSLENLYRMGNNDDVFVASMLEIFVSTTKEYLAQMHRGLRTHSSKEIAEAAHKMVPACKHLDLEELSDALKSLERLAQNSKDTKALAGRVEQIQLSLLPIINLVQEEITQIKAKKLASQRS